MNRRCDAHPRGTWAALRCRVIPCARRCEELIAAEVAWARETREARTRSTIGMNARRRGLARAQRERDAARADYLEANLKAIDEELQLWEHQRLMIEHGVNRWVSADAGAALRIRPLLDDDFDPEDYRRKIREG